MHLILQVQVQVQVKKWRGGKEVKRRRGAGADCRGAEVQGCRGADVQVKRCRGGGGGAAKVVQRFGAVLRC